MRHGRRGHSVAGEGGAKAVRGARSVEE